MTEQDADAENVREAGWDTPGYKGVAPDWMKARLLATVSKEDAEFIGRVVEENESLKARLEKYEAALYHIIQGEEEAPVGMSNPTTLARQALSALQEEEG